MNETSKVPLPPSEHSVRDQLQALFDVLQRTLHYWKVVAVIAVVGAVLSVILALTQKHAYESETVLLYHEKISQTMLAGRDAVQSTRKMSSRFKEMLLSRSTLSSVVEDFSLFPKEVEKFGTIAAAEKLQSRIKFRDRGAGTFRISYRGDTRDEAQKVTARLAELVRTQDNRVRLEQASQTKNFIESQRVEAENELLTQEEALTTFMANHPEFAIDTAAGGDAVGAGIRAANARKGQKTVDTVTQTLERQRARIRARLANPNAPVVISRTPTNRETPALKSAKKNLASKQALLNDRLQKYTDKHPDVKSAQNAVAEAKLRLQAASGGGTQTTSLPPVRNAVDKETLKRELSKIEKDLAARKANTASANQANAKSSLAQTLVTLETEHALLSRKVEEAGERLETLEQKAFTANISASTEFVDAAQLVVIDEAFRPTNPAGKGRKLIAIAGTIIFTALGLVLAVCLALVDDRIYRKKDLEKISSLKVLASIPAPLQGKRGKFL